MITTIYPRRASNCIIIAAAAALGLCPLRAQDSSHIIKADSVKVPDKTGQQWMALSGIMTFLKTTPFSAFSELPEGPDARDCTSLYSSARRLVADLGYRFFADNPADPRRWTWLEFVLDNHLDDYLAMNYNFRTGLTGGVSTEQAQAEDQWKKDIASAESACLAAPSAPVNLRCRLRLEPIAREVSGATIEAMSGRKKGWDIDWEKFAKEIEDVAAEFPDANSKTLTDSAALVVKNARGYAEDGGDSIKAGFRSSKNASLRALAAGPDAIAEAMKTPMEMRFVDVEGRKVDLAAMRGKVVLIDFRKVTWGDEVGKEDPLMKSLYAKYHAKGFEIISITWEMNKSLSQPVLQYKKDHDLPWAFYFDGSFKNPYIDKFGFTVLPQYLFVDKNGLVIRHMAGVLGLARGEVDSLIEKSLATAAPQ